MGNQSSAQLQQENDRYAAQCDRLQSELAQARTLCDAQRSHLETLQQENERLKKSASQERAQLLSTIAQVANLFLRSPDYTTVFPDLVRLLGEAVGSDRCTITQDVIHPNSGKPAVRELIEWYRNGIINSKQATAELQVALEWENLPEFREKFLRGESANFLIDQLQAPSCEVFGGQGVASILAVPIMIGGQPWGKIRFDNCGEPRLYDEAEIAILRIAANSIASAIERQAKEGELQQAQQALLQAEQERSQELDCLNTELQNTLDRLSKSEHRFRELFENTNDGIYFATLDEKFSTDLPTEEQVRLIYENLRLIDANPAFAKMYGCNNPAEINGLQLQEIHSSNFVNIQLQRAIVENGYQVSNFESEDFDENGEKRYWLSTVFETVENNQAIRAWGIISNVTELRRAQEELLRAEQDRLAELAKANQALKNSLDRLAANPDLNSFLGYVLLEIAQQLNLDQVTLWLYDAATETLPLELQIRDGQVKLKHEIDAPEAMLRPSTSSTPVWDILLQTKQPFVIDYGNIDYGNAKEYVFQNTDEHQVNELRLQLAVNLLLTIGDEPIGILALGSTRRTCFTPEELELAQALTQQATLAIQLTRLAESAKQTAVAREQEQAAQKRAAQFAQANYTLKRTLDVLAHEPELDRALDHVLQVTSEQLESASSALWLYDQNSNRFSLHLVYLNGDIIVASPQTLDRLEGHWIWKGDLPRDLALKQHIRDRAPVLYTRDSLRPVQRRLLEKMGIQAILGIPLLLGSEVVGSFTIRFPDARELQPEDFELVQALTHQATLATQLLNMANQAQQSAIVAERNRIAQDIHDTLAQAFGGILIQLQATRYFFRHNPDQAVEQFNAAIDLARQGLAEARRSVWTLYDRSIDYQMLETTLPLLVGRLTAGSSTEAIVTVTGTSYPVDPEVGQNLLRLAQEAIHNALRHAYAQTIHLTLSYAPHDLTLSIQDDGRGFDPSQPISGFGIASMKQRAEYLSSTLNLTSQPGKGTEVAIVVPTTTAASEPPNLAHYLPADASKP